LKWRFSSPIFVIKNRKFTLVLIGIALVGLVIRIMPIVPRRDVGWAMEPNGDSFIYLALADGLKHGCGFRWWADDHCASAPETSRPPGYPVYLSLTVPETNRTPGYPVFLSLMPGLRTALVVQGLLGSLLCFFVGVLAAMLAGTRAGYCAAALLAADLPSIISANEIMSEALFTALLVGGVLAELEVLRMGTSTGKVYGLLGFASVMFGLALLVRPIAEWMMPLVILALLLSGGTSWWKRVLLAGLVATGPVIFGTAWILRNYSVAGIATISTIGAVNLFYYRALGTLAFVSQAQLSKALIATHPQSHSDLTVRAVRIILQHPFAFTAMTLWSFFYLCWVSVRASLAQVLGINSTWRILNPGSVRIEGLARNLWAGNSTALGGIFAQEFQSSFALVSLVIVQLLMIGFTWAGVMLALKKCLRRRSQLGSCVLFAFAAALLLLLLAAGPEAVPRFRVPAMPLLAFLAGVGWFGTVEINSETR
jgi:hypothetical protein